MSKIRTIFIGTPDFGARALNELIKSDYFDVVAVVTQPDKRVGRKQELVFSPIKQIAIENNIEVLQPEKINQNIDKIAELKPDLLVVIAYAQIISQKLLDLPRYGCVNVHGSLLPKYRGSSCIQAAILNGDVETGVTIMKMDKGLDTGPVINQGRIKIENNDTAGSVFDKLADLGGEMIVSTLKAYVEGEIKPKDQDSSQSSYVGNLKKSDGEINWSKKAIDVERFVRAMSPWPCAFTVLDDGKSLKMIKVSEKVIEGNDKECGELFFDENRLMVQCGEGCVIIEELQVEGKKKVKAKEFVSGYNRFLNTKLK